MGARKAVIAAILGLVFTPAQAQTGSFSRLLDSQSGTLSVIPNPMFSGGSLTGCTVVFNSLQRDFSGKQGRFIKVDGSFGYLQGSNGLGVSLKVVVQDIDDETMNMRPSAPVSVYFVAQDGLRNSAKMRSATIPSDTPGGRMVAYPVEVGDFILDALESDKITIAFARSPNGIDIRVPLDLTVKDTKPSGEKVRDPANLLPVIQCIRQLMEAAR